MRAGCGTAAGESGFGDFYTTEYVALRRYCARYVGPADAEEMAQETMTRVCARWSSLERPRAYAYRVADHLAHRTWRRAQLEERALTAAAVGRSMPGTHEVEVRDAIDRLPPTHRTAVTLHYLYDMNVETVATTVHRPPGTIKRWLHEARSSLRQALAET